jgi:hypothetical protein
MKHGKILAAALAIAGGVTMGLGAGVSAVSAQTEVICAPGLLFMPGYGCVTPQPAATIYVIPPAGAVMGPSENYALGLQNGIDGGDHQHGDYNGAAD